MKGSNCLCSQFSVCTDAVGRSSDILQTLDLPYFWLKWWGFGVHHLSLLLTETILEHPHKIDVFAGREEMLPFSSSKNQIPSNQIKTPETNTLFKYSTPIPLKFWDILAFIFHGDEIMIRLHFPWKGIYFYAYFNNQFHVFIKQADTGKKISLFFPKQHLFLSNLLDQKSFFLLSLIENSVNRVFCEAVFIYELHLHQQNQYLLEVPCR